MKTVNALLFVCLLSSSVFAQRHLSPAEMDCIKYLEGIKKPFEATKNDSTFILEKSDRKQVSRSIIIRGDQAEDIETDIFGAAPGLVVGPFEGSDNYYLLKILSYENKECIKAKQFTFIPKNEMITDTAKFRKLVEGYSKDLCKGKDISKKALKDADLVAIKGKPLGTFWEANTNKPFQAILFNRKKEEPVIFRSNGNLEVLVVTDEKSSQPYSAKVFTIMKKVVK